MKILKIRVLVTNSYKNSLELFYFLIRTSVVKKEEVFDSSKKYRIKCYFIYLSIKDRNPYSYIYLAIFKNLIAKLLTI